MARLVAVALCLAWLLGGSGAFRVVSPDRWVQLARTVEHPRRWSLKRSKVDDGRVGTASAGDGEDEELAVKQLAYELLDCLTSTKDDDSPEYNYQKDIRRDAVLRENDYTDLQIELKRRGLSTSGDKLEMMIRLLLHVVDPGMNFRDLTGREATVRYIDGGDIEAKKVLVVPEAERRPSSIDDSPDAEDLMLYKRSLLQGAAASAEPKRRIIMDGLTRQEVQFRPLHIRRPQPRADAVQSSLGAYVVGGRDVLRTWERNAVVVVLVPDERGWRSRAMRVLADEIAFLIQAIVLVPEVRTGTESPPGGESKGIAPNPSTPESGVKGADRDNRPEEHRRAVVFDDIVSAMDFSRYQYASRSLCLAGVGSGANDALHVASELTDIGHLLAEKDASFYSFNGSSLAPNRLVLDPSIAELGRLGEGEEGGEAERLGSESRGGAEMNPGVLVSTDSLPRATGQVDAAADIAAEEAQWMAALRELGERYDEEDRLAFESGGGKPEGTGGSGDVAGDGLGAREGQIGTDPLDPLNAIDDTTILAAISVADQKQKALEAECAEGQRIKREQARQARVEATERSAGRVLQANKRSAIRAFRGRFLSETGSLTPKELVQILPKAVLALCPDTHDGAFAALGETLRIPACIVLGTDEQTHGERTGQKEEGEEGEGGGDEDAAARMQSALASRLDEIIDYSIRVYASLGPRSFGNDSSAEPLPETEVKSRQNAVAVGAFWLDVYSRAARDDRTIGIGLNKYSEDALIRISAGDLHEMPLRSSPITAELHDDPTLFKNSRIVDPVKKSVHGRVEDLGPSIIQRGQSSLE